MRQTENRQDIGEKEAGDAGKGRQKATGRGLKMKPEQRDCRRGG